MEPLIFLILIIIGAGSVGSVKIVNEKNQYLVESLGSYKKTLEPGLNFVTPFIDKVVFRGTIREKVLDIPPQSCITRDNVSITADAVVYWRIVDMYKAYYKVENLQSAMVNLVLTQIRSEMGQLELDQTFTARTEINELLLRELDISTDPWGVKVTRVELRDIVPSQAVQESMELQMAAERKKRAAVLTSEGEREAAINSAQGRAESNLLEAEAQKKAAILAAEAEKASIILRAEAARQETIMKAQASAQATQIVSQQLQESPAARELQHEDGHSLLLAATNPAVVAYDPAYAFELAHIVKDGLRRMYGENSENIFYYLTVYNEPYVQPAEPENLDVAGLLKGVYLYSPAKKSRKRSAQILASGVGVNWALKAQQLLNDDWGVKASVWSVTSWNELRRDGLETDQHNLLNPNDQRQAYVTEKLADAKGPIVAVSDYMRAVQDQIAPWIEQPFYSLGTDGFGLSDTRGALRRHFKVDAESIAVAVLQQLVETGKIKKSVLTKAMAKYKIHDVTAADAGNTEGSG